MGSASVSAGPRTVTRTYVGSSHDGFESRGVPGDGVAAGAVVNHERQM